MIQESRPSATFSFGDFTLDLSAYELRHQGRRVRLERRPMELLILLVERRSQLITRADIVEHLWGADVFVDAETGVNTVIWKVRNALRDSSDNPAFVETVPGKGYRFIATVDVLSDQRKRAASAEQAAFSQPDQPGHDSRRTPVMPSEGTDADRNEPVAAGAVVRAAELAAADRPGHKRLVVVLLGVVLLAGLGMMAWRGGNRPGMRITLGVLPFENMEGNPDWEYLADGLVEETIVSLGQIAPDQLSVIGRTSMMAYKRTVKSLAEIGRELQVDYLVESSIRGEGERLRVTSKLIRATDQVQIWSASYDREPTSMLGLQRELSTAIAQQVRIRLLPDRLGMLARRQTSNADAYEAYLKGRYFEDRRNRDSSRLAVEYFRQAIALDPDYALAWSGLAFTYAASGLNSDTAPRDIRPRARDAAAQAIRANPNLSEAQFAVGYVNWLLDWDWPAAEPAFRRAIDLDPNNSTALRTLGHVLSQTGRHRDADALMRRTRELDPLAAMSHALSSQVAFQARESAAAVAHAQQAILVDSGFWIGYAQLAQAYGQMGQADLAFGALADAAHFSGGENSITMSLKGYLLAQAGRMGEAREVIRRLEALSRERYIPPYSIALVYAGLDELPSALEWLEKAHAERDVQLIFLPVDPKWDRFRTDPSLQALIARCGFARE